MALLAVFAARVNWLDIWAAIRGTSLWVLLFATLVNLAAGVVKAIRWWVFLSAIGVRSLPLALRAGFAGAGLNNILVANGGDAARVVFVARAAQVDGARVAATFVLERLFDLIGYILLLALAATFFTLPPRLAGVRPFALMALVIVAALLAWLLRRPAPAAELVVPGVASWRDRVRMHQSRFVHTVGAIASGPRFLGALLLSVVAWTLQVATYQLTAQAAHFPITVGGTVAALLAVNLGFAVRATPGNVGLFQAAYAATAVALGLDEDQAIAVAFLIQTQQILPVTLLGVCLAPEFIMRGSRRRSDDGPA